MHLCATIYILFTPVACAFQLFFAIGNNSKHANGNSLLFRQTSTTTTYTRTQIQSIRGSDADDDVTKSCGFKTLPDYLEEHDVDAELHQIICQTATACYKISQKLAILPITSLTTSGQSEGNGDINVQGEEQKPMDVIANNMFKECLKNYVGAMASEEDEEIIITPDNNKKFEIAFDPLDGSSNLDVSVPTGSIFGIAPYTRAEPFSSCGRALSAAGYTVYSSSLELVISLSSSSRGQQCHGDNKDSVAAGFTLDPTRIISNNEANYAECFVLSRPDMKCPPKGSFYSLNDGRAPDWPGGLKSWIFDAKRGLTPSGTVYSSRYICSLCADVHRTFIKGGWAGNPRPHLRLLYEAAPLAHIAAACGGRGSDGSMDLLDIIPENIHSRTCVFIGSVEDINELEGYGDIQQSAKSY